MARSARKELFGFHEYVDLGTGVLLSSTLFAEVVDPANCQREKTADGTFDVVDAKLGNCLFSLGATPRQLDVPRSPRLILYAKCAFRIWCALTCAFRICPTENHAGIPLGCALTCALKNRAYGASVPAGGVCLQGQNDGIRVSSTTPVPFPISPGLSAGGLDSRPFLAWALAAAGLGSAAAGAAGGAACTSG